ncbi:MAG: phosphopentomutase [Bacteroidota bacterium]
MLTNGKIILIILDGVGVGELPDANLYGDVGANTLSNISKKIGGLDLPNLTSFGLGNIISISGVKPNDFPRASFGKMQEISHGKDSTTGHWEIAGIILEKDFPYFPDGFPNEIIEKFISLNDLKGVLGNKVASGTNIINELGDEHVRTGFPIVYTSADSVFQIAAHEDVISIERLYEICKIARDKIFIEKNSVGRVIARPFIGADGNYSRTKNRKDFSLDPPKKTILDLLFENGIETISIGKVDDLFNLRGIKTSHHTKSNAEGVEKILFEMENKSRGLIFANLVDFDQQFGHRQDPIGFANALMEFDQWLPQIEKKLNENDILILTADHGNDPTDDSTDHSREFVPLLVFSNRQQTGKDLGTRQTFSDIAQTIGEYFSLNCNDLAGKSFLKNILDV